MPETQVFRLEEFDKNKCYGFALSTRFTGSHSRSNQEYFTTNPIQYLGKWLSKERWGQMDGAGGAENFEKGHRIVYDYHGKTCFVELDCQTDGVDGANSASANSASANSANNASANVKSVKSVISFGNTTQEKGKIKVEDHKTLNKGEEVYYKENKNDKNFKMGTYVMTKIIPTAQPGAQIGIYPPDIIVHIIKVNGENEEVFNKPIYIQKLGGGKRKTRRNRKSKKSRKGKPNKTRKYKTQKVRRKSNRGRR
jgi:hypothetical protein